MDKKALIKQIMNLGMEVAGLEDQLARLNWKMNELIEQLEPNEKKRDKLWEELVKE